MKEDNDTKDLNTWEVPLNLAYMTYAAKDAYACYDMYMQILDMRSCLLPVTDEYTDSRSGMIKRASDMYKHLYHLSVSCISMCVVIICFVRNISSKNPLTCLLFSLSSETSPYLFSIKLSYRMPFLRILVAICLCM